MTQKEHAEEELRSCCQTLCESQVVMDYIKELELEVQTLKQQINKLTTQTKP